MFDWLFEGRPTVYVILVGAAGFMLVFWWQTRKRWCLIGVTIAAALLGLYAILDFAVETDREQIVRKIKAMAASVNAGDVDAAFEHISDAFLSPHRKNKENLREMAKMYIGQKIVERVEIWDIVCLDKPSRQDRTAKAFFQVKIHGQPGVEGFLAECDATFEFDPAHGWRLKSARLLKPQTTEEWPFQI